MGHNHKKERRYVIALWQQKHWKLKIKIDRITRNVFKNILKRHFRKMKMDKHLNRLTNKKKSVFANVN